jgi:hypothetical protein
VEQCRRWGIRFRLTAKQPATNPDAYTVGSNVGINPIHCRLVPAPNTELKYTQK